MPRGRKQFKPKGRNKHYTSQEEVKDQEEKKQREKEWKRKKGQVVSDSEEEEEDEGGAVGLSHGAPGELPPSSSEEESDDVETEHKSKGVESLIEVENPNRVAAKTIKAKDLDINTEVTLSRREREELERQRAAESYRRLHEAGKTDEARRDLARLAIIRQQREEAAKKRLAEKKAAEAAAAAKKK